MSGAVPEGWAWTEIAEVLERQDNNKPFQQGWSPQCESFPASKGEWGVLKTTAIQDGEFRDYENKKLPDHLDPKPNIEVMPGDIIMTCAGPRNRCGVTCHVMLTRSRVMMSGKMYRFRPLPDMMDTRFLSFYLATREATDAIDEMKTGISDSGLNLTHGRFALLPLPVAPLAEQRRIVEKIETLFAEVDAGVESLRRARVLLGLYRQSVLKHAFEGRLTADWRAANPDAVEDPETLLSRIRTERDARHAQALEDWGRAVDAWRAGGEEWRKPGKPKKPKFETNQPLFEVISIDALPSGWSAFKLVEIIDIVSGSTPKGIEDCQGEDFPFFKISDMNAEGNERFLSHSPIVASALEARNLGLFICPAGTIVFPKRGGAILTEKKRRLGKLAAFDLNTMGLVNRTETVSDDYVWYWMLGVKLSTIYDGSNVPQINNKNIDPLSFPLCSPAEQAELIARLDAKLSVIDAQEAEIDAQLARAGALRQSILKRAFSGTLVPQDPADEPAATLLARIRAARGATPKPGRNTRRSDTP